MTSFSRRMPRGVIRIKDISSDGPTCELAQLGHEPRPGTPPPTLPVGPHLSRCADSGGGFLERQILPFPPAAQRVLGGEMCHSGTTQPISDRNIVGWGQRVSV